MTDTYFQVIAHYQAKPEEAETVVGLLGELAAASRTEAANLAYDYYRSPENPDRFVILERYTDAEGFAAHRDYEHFQRIGMGEIIPRLLNRTVESYEGRTDA